MSKPVLSLLFLALLLPAEEIVMSCDFKSGGHGWSIPPYYQGKSEVCKTGGRQDGALKLASTTDQKGHTWARTYHGIRTPWKPGKCLRISGYVRGKGIFLSGFAMSLPQPDNKKMIHHHDESPVNLTSQWQYFEHFLNDGLGVPHDIQARLELEGPGEVWIDDLCVSFVDADKTRITIQPASVKITVSEQFPTMTILGKPGTEIIISLTDAQKRLLLKEKLVFNRQGRSEFLPMETLAVGHYQLQASSRGLYAVADIEVLAK